MCFSMYASFGVGLFLLVVSALSLQKASSRKMQFLALTPLFFGLQQIFEGFVWLTLQHPYSNTHFSQLYHVGVYGFLFFALGFWPMYIPHTISLLEPEGRRKTVLMAFDIMGGAVGALLLFIIFKYGAAAQISNNNIAYKLSGIDALMTQYKLSNWQWFLMPLCTGIYALVTITPLFISSISRMWLVGLTIASGFFVSLYLYQHAFGSVWCFFAAIASILIYAIVK